MILQASANLKEQIEIKWGTKQAVAELRRTERRVLRIEVRPSGDVVVIAPTGEQVDRIKERVNRKRPWIFHKIDTILGRPLRTPQRHYVSGETHLFLGKQYRLSVERGDDPEVRIEGSRLQVVSRFRDDPVYCRRLLIQFYAASARRIFQQRLHAVAPPFIRRGMQMPTLIVRQMSKRWGSYTREGRIVLNVDLVRAKPKLIDYVICHELTHAFYPDHGKEWRNLLNTVMPDWESRKLRLEALLH